MSHDPIVIIGAKRTPMGGLSGIFNDVTSATLGGISIAAAVAEANIDKNRIDEVYMGCVLQAGQGQAPARQATIAAGLPNSIGATTINKMCGSGMKAIMLAYNSLLAGINDIVVAGGQENMTQAPYLVAKGRSGYRLGHGQLYDHMFLDGLEDAYNRGTLMGVFAEETAKKYQFSREQQDEFAINSTKRAQLAIEKGYFTDQIAAVTVKTRQGEMTHLIDEQPGKAKIEKIPQLKPAFAKDGSVTAANSSSISDGGAALVLTRESIAKAQGLTPIAKIIGQSQFAQDPAWFTTAPVGAILQLLKTTKLSINDIDLFEINEAFAVVTMAALHDLSISPEIVNINGGACALGHPIGASGARIVVTLIHALRQQQKKRGIATLCIGGGEACALAIELL